MKGNFMQNTAIMTPVTRVKSITLRDNTLCAKRCAKGRARGKLYAPMTATIVAMMCSAGASAPTHPVCEFLYEDIYPK